MKNYWLQMAFKLAVALWLLVASVLAIDTFRGTALWDAKSLSWEFLKTVIGPFVGAALAFVVNDVVHNQRKREEEKIALLGAASAIRGMYRDFTRFRLTARFDVDWLHQEHSKTPNDPAPIWAYARPFFFTFITNNLPDLSKLQFLLASDTGLKAFSSLQELENAYRDLETAHKYYVDAVDALQDKMHIATGTTWAENEAQLGRKLTANVRAFLLAILRRVDDENGEPYYVNAFNNLQTAAKAYFKAELTFPSLSVDDEKFDVKNVPPLPKPLADQLYKMVG